MQLKNSFGQILSGLKKFSTLSTALLVFSVSCTTTEHETVTPPTAPPSQSKPNHPAQTPGPVAHTEIVDLKPTVILVSIDAFRHDYLDLWNVPTLQALANTGTRAEVLNSVFPSLTFPNHYTQVTGLYPEHHGIVANNMRDPILPDRFSISDANVVDDPSWWGGEPVWVTAELQKQKAATMFWPGSSAPIKNVRPSFWSEFDGKVTPIARSQKVLDWIDLPAAQRPTLITLYFEAVDSAAHHFGPEAPEVGDAAKQIDDAIAFLYNGLKSRGIGDRVNLVFVSDHGMTETSSDRLASLQDFIDLKTVEMVGGGSVTHIFPNSIHDTAAIFNKLSRMSPHVKVYLKNRIPAKFHYRNNARIPPILLVADEGWYVVNAPRNINKGSHGFDPNLPSMKAFFVAHGPAFEAGKRIPAYNSLDVYELVCQLLGLKPALNDGSAANAAALIRKQTNRSAPGSANRSAPGSANRSAPGSANRSAPGSANR